MEEYVDPFDYLEEEPGEKLEEAIEDPYDTEFRVEEPENINFPTADDSIRGAKVDLVNNNVTIQFKFQLVDEAYVVVLSGGEATLVESHANLPGRTGRETTTQYHLVTPEADLKHDGEGYIESLNTLPRYAAEKAPDFVETAHRISENESRRAKRTSWEKTRSVPPPRKGFMD